MDYPAADGHCNMARKRQQQALFSTFVVIHAVMPLCHALVWWRPQRPILRHLHSLCSLDAIFTSLTTKTSLLVGLCAVVYRSFTSLNHASWQFTCFVILQSCAISPMHFHQPQRLSTSSPMDAMWTMTNSGNIHQWQYRIKTSLGSCKLHNE